jgi:small subunit ribosomal protein S2
MTRQPAAIFLVDILKENIAMHEAKRLNIPIFAMVDTNSNPKFVDFPIPANDDATKSISIILDAICDAIKLGLEDRKNTKEKGTDKTDVSDVAEVAAPEVIAEATPEVIIEATPEVIVEATPEVTEEIAETKEETKED